MSEGGNLRGRGQVVLVVGRHGQTMTREAAIATASKERREV